MLCTCIYLGHASMTTILRDFGHEFTACKFPNSPKFVVDLPQSVLECGFNAQLCPVVVVVLIAGTQIQCPSQEALMTFH